MYRLTIIITILVLGTLGPIGAGAQTTPAPASIDGAETPLTIARIDSLTWQ